MPGGSFAFIKSFIGPEGQVPELGLIDNHNRKKM